MRNLARSLGIEAMTIYYYLASKDELVDAIVDRVFREAELPTEAADWRADVRSGAISVYQALIRHPWACMPAMAPPRSQMMPIGRIRYMNWIARLLADAGFSGELAFNAYHALDGHVLGFTVWQLGHGGIAPEVLRTANAILRSLPEGEYEPLASHFDQHLARGRSGPGGFSFGLEIVIDGLTRSLETGRGPGI